MSRVSVAVDGRVSSTSQSVVSVTVSELLTLLENLALGISEVIDMLSGIMTNASAYPARNTASQI